VLTRDRIAYKLKLSRAETKYLQFRQWGKGRSRQAALGARSGRAHGAGEAGLIVLSRYSASEDTCNSVSGPPSVAANPGINVFGLPRVMIPFQ
jgi:hypothetical protein